MESKQAGTDSTSISEERKPGTEKYELLKFENVKKS